MSGSDRYEILQQDAAKGGFGRIHRAKDRILGRDVAIKELDPIFKLKPSEADKERFRREARTLASLSHPGIPAIYDVQLDEATETFRILFQWIEGSTLTQHLASNGILSLEQARRWFGTMCSALTHAHSKGVVHRDVKPSNIILGHSDHCTIVDFGISLSVTEISRLTQTPGLGTPGYMAPEQEKGHAVTAAADLFSLGIVLYESLSGTRPSVGQYRSLSSASEAIPPAIDTLIQDCLAPDPSARLSSCAEFASRLNRALEPHASFSSTLSNGSLFEVQLAIGAMSPAVYAALPVGQRLSVVARLKDLVRVDDPRLANAVAALLGELVRVCHGARVDDYRYIGEQALIYGFERRFGESWLGNRQLREALNAVVPTLRGDAQARLSEAVLKHVEGNRLTNKAKWYLHDMRILIQGLLVHADCGETHAERLAGILEDVNQLSHASPNAGRMSAEDELSI